MSENWLIYSLQMYVPMRFAAFLFISYAKVTIFCGKMCNFANE